MRSIGMNSALPPHTNFRSERFAILDIDVTADERGAGASNS